MRKYIYFGSIFLFFLIASVALSGFILRQSGKTNETPLFITGLAPYKAGFVASQKGTRELAYYSSDWKECLQRWELDEVPTGVTATADNIYVTVAGEDKNGVYILSASSDAKEYIPTGSGACYPLVDEQSNKLYVCNQFSTTITEIDLTTRKVSREARALREPKSAVIDAKRKYLLVANFLPRQRADVDTVSACVSVIDLNRFQKVTDIPLANGSNALRGVAVSPDGRYLLVTHNLGRFQVPTSQLQQGWMNTSAMSVVNLDNLRFEGTVLLDEPERGAAGIWDVKSTENKVVITHSGTHDISIIDYPAFIRKFEAYPQKDALAYDLRFMYDVRRRVAIEGNGPRSLLLKDQMAVVPTYFSDTLNMVNLNTLHVNTVALVNNRTESRIQRGEKYFNDADFCFQNWQSCNGCHPGDGRTDGMNWDLMNDGIGNPKNCKSMLFSHVTPPNMISGIRASANVAVRAGFTHIQFSDIPEDFAACVDEYLMNLKPVPSPYLVNGELSEKAQRGRKIFEKLKCDECHSGPYYTDMKMYRIGEDIEFENGWDTPTLREVWRTAPYLFDGRAATMKDVFSEHKHGIEKKVSDKEIDELVEYVNSL